MRPDIAGQKFGRWTVVALSHEKLPHRYWNCRCECGAERVVVDQSLRGGKSKSCGCLAREITSKVKTKHRGCNHPAYQSWVAMNRRCYDENFDGYAQYGGRGIRVCDKWHSFTGFWDDMADTWHIGLTIDRLDNDGNYETHNCRWATDMEQAHNKRNNLMLNTPWGRISQSEAARRAGISVGSLVHRIKAGWPASTLFLPPSRK